MPIDNVARHTNYGESCPRCGHREGTYTTFVLYRCRTCGGLYCHACSSQDPYVCKYCFDQQRREEERQRQEAEARRKREEEEERRRRQEEEKRRQQEEERKRREEEERQKREEEKRRKQEKRRRELEENIMNTNKLFDLQDLADAMEFDSIDDLLDYLLDKGIDLSFSGSGLSRPQYNPPFQPYKNTNLSGSQYINRGNIRNALNNIKADPSANKGQFNRSTIDKKIDDLFKDSQRSKEIKEMLDKNPEITDKIGELMQKNKNRPKVMKYTLDYIFKCCEIANDYYEIKSLLSGFGPINRLSIIQQLNELPDDPALWTAHHGFQDKIRRKNPTGLGWDKEYLYSDPNHPGHAASDIAEEAYYAYHGEWANYG